MDKSRLGELISFYRNERNISQAWLCRGLCSSSKMSRIELGDLDIPMLLAQALLERIGVTVSRFELISDEIDYQLYEKRNEIERLIKEYRFQEAHRSLNNYETFISGNDLLNRQYIALSRAKLIKEEQGRLEIAEALLEEAESYTIDYSSKNIKEFPLYSQTEIDIILTRARIYMEDGKIEEAEHTFFNLYRYMKYFNTKELREKLLPEVLLEMAGLFFQGKGYGLALEMVEEGLENIKDSRSYQYAAELHFLYARSLWNLNEQRGCEGKVKEECARRCLQAYYLYQFDEDGRKEVVSKYMQEELEWEFTGLERL